MIRIGAIEFAIILLIVSGTFPELFNLIGIGRYCTPLFLLGAKVVLGGKPFLWFLLLLHMAPAAFLLDDALQLEDTPKVAAVEEQADGDAGATAAAKKKKKKLN